jgi:predicted ATPase/DNA-binding SARP family transcriptional activator
VLGPVELVAGQPVPLAAKQRRLLAALLTRLGVPYPDDALLAAVWSDAQPRSARSLLQVYISQLRKALPPPAEIVRVESGYKLVVEAEALTATTFERLLREGTEARADGNPLLAASLLRRALGLWRGGAYGELAYEDFAHAEADRLEELRLVCLEEWADAELAVGRHSAILPELRASVAAHPERERLQGTLMLALYRCGRQTDALGVYTAVRAHLADELGLEPGAELRDLQRRILGHDPSLAAERAPPAARPTLPVFQGALFGRERELGELGSLLGGGMRLITLSGAGGSGKTRLAVEAARRAAPAFANGAVFVDLAPVRDPQLVPRAILTAVGIAQEPTEARAALLSALANREILVLLDNAEHLPDTFPLFTEMLAVAPRLTLLVTSRVVLHLSGEHVYPVEPLSDEAARALFHERALSVAPRLREAAQDEDVIAAICTSLDRLPLAIELAAGRTRSLTPGELVERLEPRMAVLAGGPRDLPARQQTLRATLEWSFELLEPSESRDLARAAVFAGGFELTAAEAICETTADRLGSLVDHNLLQHGGRDSVSRYTMLETIREYALERLEATPEADDVRSRHASHFLDVARRANLNPGRFAAGGQHLAIANAEQDNIRAALGWLLATGEIERGLELASAMDMFWTAHDANEGIKWFSALLDHPGARAVPLALRAHCLRGLGSSHAIAGDTEAAAGLWEESLALFERLGDEHGRAVLLHRVGSVALWKGDFERARALIEESHRLHDRDEVPIERTFGLMQTTGALGAFARDTGDAQRAAELIDESAHMASEAGIPWWEAGMFAELGCLELQAGRLDNAEKLARESLATADEIGDRPGRIFGVGLLAAVAAACGERELAARLWTAVAQEDVVAPLGGWRRHRETCASFIAAVTQPPDAARPDLDEAVALALTTRRFAHPRPQAVVEASPDEEPVTAGNPSFVDIA